jgi:tetratricopeptide (TPR) repeat protein
MRRFLRVWRVRHAWFAAVILGAGLLFRPTVAQDSPAGTVPLRLIVVNSLAEAQRILELLNRGADFGVLAQEKSVDATAADGGWMGEVAPGTLRAELRDALRGLQPGRISQVINLPAGFAILKVVPASELAAAREAERAIQQALSPTNGVRYAFDLSGLFEAETALGDIPKPPGWSQNLQQICFARRKSLEVAREGTAKYLDPASEGAQTRSAYDTMSMRVALGQLWAYDGNMDQAIEQWEIVYRSVPASSADTVSYLDELLGVGYLHKSEMENDAYRKPGDRCLFPPRVSTAYRLPADSEKAAQHFLKYLERKPDDLEVKWLLNISYLTLGKYPNGVPKAYLLPPAQFASAEDIGRFIDRAPVAGLNSFSMAGGVAVDDFEGNGRFDVVTSSQGTCAPMHYFHNNGDGTFSDRTESAGLSTQLGGLNLMQTDYNNDGCMDLLVLRGGWQTVPQRVSLLRNNCNGTFTDVTLESGLGQVTADTQTAVWVDIDNDGFLDLFVGNEVGPNQLYHNNGDGTFTNIAHAAGVDRVAVTKGVAAGDYDNDGYMDLYVSNLQGAGSLYHNNHDGTFTDIAKQAGVLGSGRGFATWFFDYDNDGWPDLFVTSFYMSIEETLKTYFGLPHNATTLKLYKNLGNGAFRDVTEEAGLNKVFMPMGANFGDVDNDGYLDIYLGTGSPSYAAMVPNVLLRNKEGSPSSISPHPPAPASCTRGTRLHSPTWTTAAMKIS